MKRRFSQEHLCLVARVRTHFLPCAALAVLGGCSRQASTPERISENPKEPWRWQTAPPDDPRPAYARWESEQSLREDLQRPRSPADGAGRAWIETDANSRREVRVGESASFLLHFEAGPLGIAEGGALYFMPNPFWGWSSPQAVDERASGFTTVSSDSEDLEWETQSYEGMLAVVLRKRAMRPHERLSLHYGAGPAGARVDRHAEREEHLWFGVDGDGDGVRAMLVESPTVDVLPGPPERLIVHAQSCARPGDNLRVGIAVLDGWANADVGFSGKIQLRGAPADWNLPAEVEILPTDGSLHVLELKSASSGIVRLEASTSWNGVAMQAESNPIWVTPEAPRVLWADLHGHSHWTDGTGTPSDYFRYARDVALLDIAALTDHDHWGVLFLDQNPQLWEKIKSEVQRYHEPGRFLSLLAYEWTSWVHGHRHVLYFEDDGEIYSSLDEESSTPRQLWEKLRGQRALTFAHHSAGNPIPTNWSFAPDPVLEPLTEIMSVHGSSEALDSPNRLSGAIPGNFVRDVLDHGYRLGFLGSGDGHDGHPGLAHLSPVYRWTRRRDGREILGTGGLAAILADQSTRESVLEAMRARKTWATSGPRILLHLQLAGQTMGAILKSSLLGSVANLKVVVLGTAELERLDLIRTGESRPLATLLEGTRDWEGSLELEHLKAGEYLYVRVIQRDGGMAWSSPYFIE